MSRLRDFHWKEALLSYLTALLLSSGMAFCMHRVFLPDQAILPALWQCALFAALLQGFFRIPSRSKWLLAGGIILSIGIWAALGGGPGHSLIQWGKTLILSLRGLKEAPLPYAAVARGAICLLFSLLGAALARDRSMPLAVFCLMAVASLGYIFGEEKQVLLYLLPAAAGLLLLLPQDGDKRLSALPLALILALGAFFLMPAEKTTVPALQKTAESIRQLIEDYLFFNDYRSSFSLKDQGYQPLDSRLGGQATPHESSVMEVRTEKTVLLRGRTYNQYSGLNWYDTLSSRRYLFASPRFSSLKENLFDLGRPLVSYMLPEAETVRIHMLSGSPTTLFIPQRTRSLQVESERMVVYYNLASELFITRNLEAGDQYTLSYLPFAPGDALTEQLVAACSQVADPYYEEVAANYLALPQHIQDEIHILAGQITWGAQTPYEKALRIQEYLQKNYTYSLNVKDPPEGVDFAAWFLLGEKTGYCTYFATAMTVLCRSVGLPARYVTGFIAQPDESGAALVTGKNAHAWTEVYLNGFGWLDFDPTPGASGNRGNEEDNENGNGAQPTVPPASPSPSPSAEPSPEPEDAQAPTPTPPPEENPDSAPSPTPPPANPDGTPPSQDPPAPPFPWWILLVLAGILLLIWRYIATDPIRCANKRPQRAVQIYFDALCLLLGFIHLQRQPSETYHDFAYRADQALAEKGLFALSPLADQYTAQVYGQHAASPLPFRDAYLALMHRASPLHRLRFTLRRMLRPFK
ncbi:MAG: transglutaminase domain-containing protein [Clostridiales bacterium]|nr:transglutaminase domain-containing protein [Clostridiales bacterium]